MKKTWRTLVSLIAALCMVLSMTAMADAALSPLGEYPLCAEKQEITVFTYEQGLDFETNWVTKWYEEKTNVHVNWSINGAEQFIEKLNLALASEDAIDVIICGGYSGTSVTASNLLKYANQGLILPLEELIENNTVYAKQRLEENDGWRETLTTPSGHIYSFPTLNECYHCMYYGKMWVNQEWLKNLGLENPTTTEEFRDMLIAFRDQDANGNGDPTDEIPMMGAIDNFGSRIDTYLMSAFIYDDGGDRLFMEDGKVVAAYMQDEFREGLAYIHGLYEEDLIYKDSFTQSRATRNQINSQKYESTVGAMGNIHHGIGNRGEGEPVRWMEYEPIAPLVGPDGLQITRYDYYNKFKADYTGLVPATCSNPELVVRWMDWMLSDEGTRMVLNGGENIGWAAADEGSHGVDGRPATWKPLILAEEDEYYKNYSWYQCFPNYNSSDARLGQQQPEDMYAQDETGLEKFLYTFSKQNYEPYGAPIDMLVPPLWYSDEAISEMAMLTTDINTYVEEAIARFIIGDLDVETDWDSFQNELKALGVDRYLEIIQETYDASAFAK